MLGAGDGDGNGLYRGRLGCPHGGKTEQAKDDHLRCGVTADDFMPKAPEVHRDAIVCMVFAVLGWMALPVIGSGLGLVYSARARRAIGADPDEFTGYELAEAARTICLAYFLMLSVVIVVAAAVFAFLLA